MKTVILAGGFGTRLAEYTDKIPKPMVQIGDKPILSHIMNFYQSYGYDEFIVAAGYKKDVITEYYKNSKEFENLTIVDNGENTMNLNIKEFSYLNQSVIHYQILNGGHGLGDYMNDIVSIIKSHIE